MSDELTLSFNETASAALEAAGEAFAGELFTVAQAQAAALLARARDLASGPLLHARIGAFLAGLSAAVERTDSGVSASLMSAGPEAPILEFGGSIPAHVIGPTVAQALRFEGGASAVFAKVVHDPGATLKPHPVLETALADRHDAIVAALTDAGLRFGR